MMLMNLYEAISVRKSVRRYNMNSFTQDKIEAILRFANSLPMLFPDIEVEFEVLDCTDDNKDNKYFNGIQPFKTKAPYYLILSSTKENGYYINAGYLMQQVSLYLTSKDIGSCFLGRIRLSDEVSINPSMEHVITLSFGESKSKTHRDIDKARRLPEEDTVTYKEDVSKDLRTIVSAGRTAPSSMNSQPWRFVAYNNRIHIFCKKNITNSKLISRMKLIDIGVSLGNMLVVMDEMWLSPDIGRLVKISNQYFKHYDYIITLKIKSYFEDF